MAMILDRPLTMPIGASGDALVDLIGERGQAYHQKVLAQPVTHRMQQGAAQGAAAEEGASTTGAIGGEGGDVDVVEEDAEVEGALYVDEDTFCVWLDRTEFTYGMAVERWFARLEGAETAG